MLSQLQMDFWVQDHFQNHTSSQTQGCCRTAGCCRFWGESDPLWATEQAHHPNSALGFGYVWYVTSRESQRSHGKRFSPLSQDQDIFCTTENHFFFLMLWALLQNVLINYCQIFSIFLISRTWGQQFQTNNKSSCVFRKSHFQSKFLRTLEYSQWKNIF